jgi:hypothetical protein
VPGFRPVGLQHEEPVEDLDRERVVLGAGGVGGAAHEEIRGVRAGARPAPLDQGRDALALGLVLGGGKALVEVVEGAGPRRRGLGLGSLGFGRGPGGGRALPGLGMDRQRGEQESEGQCKTKHAGII